MWVSPAKPSHFEQLCSALKSHHELQRSNPTSHGMKYSKIKTHCQTFLFVHWLSQGFLIAANNDVHTRMTLKYCHTYDCVGWNLYQRWPRISPITNWHHTRNQWMTETTLINNYHIKAKWDKNLKWVIIMQKNIQVARLWNKDLKKMMHNLEVLRTRKKRLLSAAYKLRGQWTKVFKNIFKKDYQKVNVNVENKLTWSFKVKK